MATIVLSLFACGILTTQHSSLARYPENGKNPLNIYTAKLPLIKKQILFMDLLEDAIKKLTKHSTESFVKKIDKTKFQPQWSLKFRLTNGIGAGRE